MIWNFLREVFSSGTGIASSTDDLGSTVVNPATGLPMLYANTCGVDVGGSPYGMDIHDSMNIYGGDFNSNPWD